MLASPTFSHLMPLILWVSSLGSPSSDLLLDSSISLNQPCQTLILILNLMCLFPARLYDLKCLSFSLWHLRWTDDWSDSQSEAPNVRVFISFPFLLQPITTVVDGTHFLVFVGPRSPFSFLPSFLYFFKQMLVYIISESHLLIKIAKLYSKIMVLDI